MKVSKEEFSLFVAAKGKAYPYNKLRITRRNYHAKWILCKEKLDRKVMRSIAEGGVKAIHTTALDKDTVRHLIVSEKAMPLPQPMEHIMDCMYLWGRNQNYVWYHSVLDWFYWLLKEQLDFPYQKLASDTIEHRMHNVIRAQLGETDWVLIDEWRLYFDAVLFPKHKNYFHLAVFSAQWVRQKCEEINNLPVALPEVTP